MKKILLIGLNAKYSHTNPAIRSLAQYAAREEVELREYTINEPIERVAEELSALDATVYGFSSYIWNIEYIRALAGKMPGKVLLGGPEASAAPEEYLAFSDYILKGEGEESFRVFADKLIRGEDVRKTPGLCYKKDGIYYENPPAPAVELAALPQPYGDLSRLKGRLVYYESSRGCPFSCAYCMSSLSGGVRFAPVEKVKKDLDAFVAAGVMKVKFVDRTFNADRARAREIFAHVIRYGGQTEFHFEIAADLLDEPTCALLATAPPGRIQLEIGVQSTYAPTLAAIERVQDFSYTARMVRRLAAGKNLHLHVDLIAGLPLEGMEQFCRSIDDVMALGAEKMQLGFLKVLKGSKMRELAGKYGIEYCKKAPYEVRATAQLSPEEVQLLHKVEYLLERTYNSGLFRQTVDYFGKTQGYASFYLALCAQLAQKGTVAEMLTERALALELLEYCSQKGGFSLEFLRLDLLLKNRRPQLPAALEQPAPWKRKLFSELPPGLLENLPQGKRPWHYARLEEFSFDVCAYLREGILHKKQGRYLFDYTGAAVQNIKTGERESFDRAFPLPPKRK